LLTPRHYNSAVRTGASDGENCESRSASGVIARRKCFAQKSDVLLAVVIARIDSVLVHHPAAGVAEPAGLSA